MSKPEIVTGCPTTQISSTSPHPPTHTGTTAFDSIGTSHADYPATMPTSATTVTNLVIPTLGAQSHHNHIVDPATTTITTTIKPQHVSGLSPAQPLPVHITTPVNIPYFKQLLQNHPDPALVEYLVNGLMNGFDIGVNEVPSVSRPQNQTRTRSSQGSHQCNCKRTESWSHRKTLRLPTMAQPPLFAVRC